MKPKAKKKRGIVVTVKRVLDEWAHCWASPRKPGDLPVGACYATLRRAGLPELKPGEVRQGAGRDRGRMSPCLHYGNAIVCVGGPEHIIDTPSGPVRFEWHRFFGPVPIRKDGCDRKLGERHPFWKLVTRWDRYGRQEDNGRCVVPPFVPCATCNGTGRGEHLGGRNYRACPAGCIDGEAR